MLILRQKSRRYFVKLQKLRNHNKTTKKIRLHCIAETSKCCKTSYLIYILHTVFFTIVNVKRKGRAPLKQVPYPKNIHNMSQRQPNPGFRSVQTDEFLIKGLTNFQKFFSIWASKNNQQAWKAKLACALSFDIHNCKKAV